MFSVSFFLFAPIILVHSLDLDAALAQGKFDQIHGNKIVELDPYNNPASSMYYDNLIREPSIREEITLVFHGEWSDEDYKLGLSLLILSLDTDNLTTSVDVFVESRRATKRLKFVSDIELPDSTIKEENIIRSWELFPEEEDTNHDGYMRITVVLKDLTLLSKVGFLHLSFFLLLSPPQIYFVATSYKVSKPGSSQNKCQPFRPLTTPDW